MLTPSTRGPHTHSSAEPADVSRRNEPVRSVTIIPAEAASSAAGGVFHNAQAAAPSATMRESRSQALTWCMWSLAALVVASVVCFGYYACALPLGFLHDDLLHFDQSWRALHGDAHDFICNLYGNWGNSDLMRSYRPLISLSFFLDCWLWGKNAAGFHCTNVLVFAATCVLVGCIADELGRTIGLSGRGVAAVCAAFLFACYPLHPESVVWIVGRVDVLCTFFYAAAVLTYLRYRRSSQRRWIYMSVGSFIVALLCKEMAVTLPLVISATLLLPQSQVAKGKNADRRVAPAQQLRALAVFWMALALFAVVRTAFIGTIIGGYGGNGWKETWASIKNLFDQVSMIKTLVPVNEEFNDLTKTVALMRPAYLLAATIAAFQLVRQRGLWRVTLFLLIWRVCGVLPTYQIWHVYPNLIGGRLFYLSSVPLCAMIALLVCPAVTAGRSWVQRSVACAAACSLIALVTMWSWLLCENLKPWIEASRQMGTLIAQLESFAELTPATQKIVLIDLPTDYRGAAMLTRQQYLMVLAKPPFISRDLTKQLMSTSSLHPDDGSRSPYDVLEHNLISSSDATLVYAWNAAQGKFTRFHKR